MNLIIATSVIALLIGTALSENLCPNGDGFYPDLNSNCRNFYRCLWSNTVFQQISTFSCPSGLLFDTNNNFCNWPNAFFCPSAQTTSTQASSATTPAITRVEPTTTPQTTTPQTATPQTTTKPTTSSTIAKIITLATSSAAKTTASTSTSPKTTTPSTKSNSSGNVVCYYTNWAQYRQGQASFKPQNIDPFLCTHIMYAFGKLNNNIVSTLEWNDDVNMKAVINLKQTNPKLKVFLSLGGWTAGSTQFSQTSSRQSSISMFINSAVSFLKTYGFDGLDIDWEYPTEGQDKANFQRLIETIRPILTSNNLMLSAAVAAGSSTIDSAYNIPSMNANMDFISIMTYDLHGYWDGVTGTNAPLYARSVDSVDNQKLTVDYAVRYWIAGGFSPKKINLGLAMYGQSFQLRSISQTGLGAPTIGPGVSGIYTSQPGILSYYEIYQKQWTTVYDNEQQVPYMFSGDQWVGFDSQQSLSAKAQYINAMGLGGAMFWALDYDDFAGQFCSQRPYPLINTVKQLLM